MKSLIKSCVAIGSIFLMAGMCKPREGWRAGEPITTELMSTWKLEKVVTPTQTISDNKLDYSEVLKIGYDGAYHVENTTRNDTLVNTQYWGFHPGPQAKTKDLTILVTYRYGLKRFYKLHETVSQPTILEASAYLPDLGGEADTVKYFYKEVW
jgi:hypothetical protein